MDNSKMKYQLFDLTPAKFEDLCYDLLNAEFKYDKSFITDGPNDNGVDILAIKGLEKTAIQIKHKYKFNENSLSNEIKRYEHLLEWHHKFIYVTSALVDEISRKNLESDKISIISQKEIYLLLEKHSSIALKYFTPVEIKNKSVKKWLSSSIIGVVLSIIASLSTFFIDKHEKDNPLQNQIQNVEQALENIKGLEKHLADIKTNMIETDIKNKKILEEYEKMQGIEDVIKDKKESLNLILNYEPWYKKALTYFLGVLTGIFTSIIGNILYKRWKLDKILKD